MCWAKVIALSIIFPLVLFWNSCSFNETTEAGVPFEYGVLPVPFSRLCYEVPDRDSVSFLDSLSDLIGLSRNNLFAGGHQDTALKYINRANALVDGLDGESADLWRARIHLEESFVRMWRKENALAQALAKLAVLESQERNDTMEMDSKLMLAYTYYADFNNEKARAILSNIDSMRNGRWYRFSQGVVYYKILGGLYYQDSTTREEFETVSNVFLDYCNGDTLCLAEWWRQKGFNVYLLNKDGDSDRPQLDSALKYLRHSLNYWQSQDCPNSIAISKTYELSAMIPQIREQYAEARQLGGQMISSFFGHDWDMDALSSNIYSLEWYVSMVETGLNKAKNVRDTSLAHRMLDSLELAYDLMSHFLKYDKDTYLSVNRYNNYLHSLLIPTAAELYQASENDYWLKLILRQIGQYKADGLRRDLNLNHALINYEEEYPTVRTLANLDHSAEVISRRIRSKNRSQTDQVKDLRQYCSLLKTTDSIYRAIKKDQPQLYRLLIPPRRFEVEHVIDNSKRDNIARIYYYTGNTWYNNEAVYCLTLYRGELDLHILDIPPDSIRMMVSSLYELHENRRDTMPQATHYAAVSYEVFEKVLMPALSNISESSELRILPEYVMSTLPFESLVVDTTVNMNDYASLDYLVRHHPVSYMFSPDESHQNNDTNERLILGMAWTDHETYSEIDDSALKELGSWESEMQTVSQNYPDAQIFTGFDCTAKNFFRYAPEASLIHLAIHGESGDGGRLESCLYFRKRHGEEVVHPHQLKYSDINPELVILSACETGSGALSREENMFSIGRMFHACGAKAVIGSVWALSDEVASGVFPAFYAQYAKGLHSAEALRKAKMDYINMQDDIHASPGYWASLVLYH